MTHVRIDRGQVVLRQLFSDIPIELPVCRIARIPLPSAPNLLAGFPISAKDRRPGRCVVGRENRETRPRLAKHQSMGIYNKPPQICLLQYLADCRNIAALRQPDAHRITSETFSIIIAADQNLSPHRLGTKLHEWKKAVRRRTGDNLQHAILLELRKSADHVAPDLVEIKIPSGDKVIGIKTRQFVELRIACRPFNFEPRQFDTTIEIPLGAMLEKRISQHGAKRWSHCQSQSNRNVLRVESPENAQQGNVGLDNSLKEPILLMKLLVFGVPNKREMSVEEKSQ